MLNCAAEITEAQQDCFYLVQLSQLENNTAATQQVAAQFQNENEEGQVSLKAMFAGAH